MQIVSPWPLQYGCTWINTLFMLVNKMPHGGLKSCGRDLGLYALEDYTLPRHVRPLSKRLLSGVQPQLSIGVK